MIRTGLDHKVTFGIGIHEHDQEGRAVTVELDKLYVVGLYVPNSGTPMDKLGGSDVRLPLYIPAYSPSSFTYPLGIKLERLTYRLDAWNPALCEYVKQLSKTKPVVVTGDLNVAHLDLDIYNASVSGAEVKPLAWSSVAMHEFLMHNTAHTYTTPVSVAAYQENVWVYASGARGLLQVSSRG